MHHHIERVAAPYPAPSHRWGWRPGPTIRLAFVVTALAAGVALLAAVGPTLPLGPGATRPDHWTAWLEVVGPSAALMAAVRALGLAVGGYLLMSCALQFMAVASGSPRLVTMARRVTLPAARRIIAGVTGTGLAVSLSIGLVAPTLASAATASPAPSATPAAPTMRRLDPDGSSPTTTTMPTPAPGTDPTTTMPTPAPGTDPTWTMPTPAPGTDPTTTMPTPAPGTDPTWTIAPGDHLWRVARQTLQGAWGRPPHDGETARYLAALIDTNRQVLVVADDPDLVFPGQVFVLPPVPAA